MVPGVPNLRISYCCPSISLGKIAGFGTTVATCTESLELDEELDPEEELEDEEEELEGCRCNLLRLAASFSFALL